MEMENQPQTATCTGLFSGRITALVLGAMRDHQEPSMPVLHGPERQREFALLILRPLTGGAGDQRLPAQSTTR